MGCYAYAMQFKRMRKALKKLKGYTGRKAPPRAVCLGLVS